MEMVVIEGQKMPVRVFDGQRVVTFADVERVHNRAEGTAKKRFHDNRKHFIENVDFFMLKPCNAGKYEVSLLDSEKSEFRTLENIPNRGLILLTETGYLMVVKSFNDDLAWNVQRQLVNGYFRAKEVLQMAQKPLAPQNDFSTLCVQVNGIEETLDNFYDRLNALEEAMSYTRPTTTLAYIGMEQKPIIDPIRDNIERLAVLYDDGSNGYNVTFRKVYLAMGVDWKNRRIRFRNKKGNKTPPSNIQLIENDKKLLKLFLETVENMIFEAESNR